MSKKANLAIVVAGLAGLFWALSRKTLAIPGAALSRARVLALATRLQAEHLPDTDPLMMAAIAEIESSRNPLAIRFEPVLGDASIGLMQTLLSTAQWLPTVGFNKFGTPGMTDLLDPEKSMYFGGAYLQWLRSWKGQARDDDFVVMSYNGGPGANSPATRAYLGKYKRALFAVSGGLAGDPGTIHEPNTEPDGIEGIGGDLDGIDGGDDPIGDVGGA